MNDDANTFTPDAFAALLALLLLMSEPKRSAELLDRLERQLDAAAKAQAHLATQRERFDKKIAAERAELDQAKAAVRAREVAVTARESLVEQGEQTLKRNAPGPRHDAGMIQGSGLVREFVHGG
jgi:uncharacterized membrane protein YccC